MSRPDYRNSQSRDWYDTVFELANEAQRQREFEISKAAAQEWLDRQWREFQLKKKRELNAKD
jgi:hypothetical protein